MSTFDLFDSTASRRTFKEVADSLAQRKRPLGINPTEVRYYEPTVEHAPPLRLTTREKYEQECREAWEAMRTGGHPDWVATDQEKERLLHDLRIRIRRMDVLGYGIIAHATRYPNNGEIIERPDGCVSIMVHLRPNKQEIPHPSSTSTPTS